MFIYILLSTLFSIRPMNYLLMTHDTFTNYLRYLDKFPPSLRRFPFTPKLSKTSFPSTIGPTLPSSLPVSLLHLSFLPVGSPSGNVVATLKPRNKSLVAVRQCRCRRITILVLSIVNRRHLEMNYTILPFYVTQKEYGP